MTIQENEGLILSIETATTTCSVALYRGQQPLAEQNYRLENSHSSLLPGVIEDILKWARVKSRDLDAIAVSSGPGSYTGLRIGLSTAKGLCFALGIPLISVSTLDTMTETAKRWVPKNSLICPMIDARRMEVYTQLVVNGGEVLWEAKPLIIDESSFDDYLDQAIYLLGNGSGKCKGVCNHKNLHFIDGQEPRSLDMGMLAWQKFLNGDFEDLAYYEPNYLKEFQTKKPSNKLFT